MVDSISAGGGKADFVAADLSDPGQLDNLVERAGAVDILVNNAGFSWFGPTADLDVGTFDRLFAANVRAPYFLVAALAPKMAARGRGSIINLASMAGQVGLVGRRRLWRHQGHAGVDDPVLGCRVQPGRRPGERHRPRPGLHRGASPSASRASVPPPSSARAAQPGEIAEVIAFLASPKASYVTGAVSRPTAAAPPSDPATRNRILAS